MAQIRVVVFGASGRVGQEVVKAATEDPSTVVVGAVDVKTSGDTLSLPDGSGSVPFSSDFGAVLESCRPDVVVDFTIAKACMPALRISAPKGVHTVIGATGFTPADLDAMKQLAEQHNVGIFIAPNFALGAVVMMHLAKIAGKYFDHAEIIELHHDRKLDAPSGTANSTAMDMVKAKGKPFLPPAAGEHAEARGLVMDGINIHSIRLPGLMAHQEVLFGGAGQTLSIRHDTINRECYMPGVLLAVKEMAGRRGFVYGLDTLLGL